MAQIDGVELLRGVRIPAVGGGFEGEHVFRLYYFAYCGSGRALLILGQSKRATGHVEHLSLLFNEVRQDAAGIGVVFAGVAEHVVLFAVPVQVHAQLHLPFLAVVGQSLLYLDQVWVENTRRLLPPPVQIHSSHIAPEITQHHSIHIHHRKHLHYEVLQNVLHFRSVFQQSPHQTIGNVGRPHFAWVLSGQYEYHLFIFEFFG